MANEVTKEASDMSDDKETDMSDAAKPLEIWKLICGQCDKRWLAKKTGDVAPSMPSHRCSAPDSTR
jgi:hypothetical protein